MKSALYFLTLLIMGLPSNSQTLVDEQKRDSEFLDATNTWFTAWKLVSKDICKINKVKPVDFVFFDDTYVYSTSTITIKKGTYIKGNDLMNLKLHWKKQLHNDSITLPDKSVIPINLMSFASDIPGESHTPFFVMPLPSFWKASGVTSKELGLENLITGVFIHEFSHSQQMQNFGKKMTEYELQTSFDFEFSDDIVQNIFSKDTLYLKYYKKEIELFYGSIKNNTLDRNSVNEGMSLLNQRQKKYFNGEYESLKQIDDFFLTMEGLGQYSMFLWLTHSKGANIEREIAIEGVRRGGKWWSQDEGFALFLILEKFTQPKKWAKDMFGDKTETITDLIDKFNLPID